MGYKLVPDGMSIVQPQALRSLRNRIPAPGNLTHRVTLEIFSEIGFVHEGLLAPDLGKQASANLGEIQFEP
jgi:hypothetical protein